MHLQTRLIWQENTRTHNVLYYATHCDVFSLGGALATLFVADIAEFGVDAGRALPQKTPSEPWWRAITNTVMGRTAQAETPEPPRPRTLRMYNFGSPRVGNPAFAESFERLMKAGRITQAYRIVNAQDVIARVPRPMLNIDYEHCGRTVLIEEPGGVGTSEGTPPDRHPDTSLGKDLWIEGESDVNRLDPVRDYRNATRSPIAEGSLLNELLRAYREASGGADATTPKPSAVEMQVLAAVANLTNDSNNGYEGPSPNESSRTPYKDNASINTRNPSNQLSEQFGALASRLSKASMTDLTTMIGIDRMYASRELQMAQSLVKGEALAHHLEDSYYAAMGRAVGFVATVGEKIVPASSPMSRGAQVALDDN
jgi:Lipase (class 3)